jgi:hypothetical protein
MMSCDKTRLYLGFGALDNLDRFRRPYLRDRPQLTREANERAA